MAEDDRLNEITERIIGCAIEVHRHLGPGLLEGIYEKALAAEMTTRGLRFHEQYPVSISYKGVELGEMRIDLLVENNVIVELKAVDKHNPVYEAQVLSSLKLTGKKLGLLINFNVPALRHGIKRIIN